MNKQLLIGIIVTFLIPLAVWIYLVWMVRKKKISLFHDQVEPKLAERRLKRLKAFLLVAGISFAMFIVGFILHGVLGALLEIEEEAVSFFIAISAIWVFFIATISGLVIFLKGLRETR